MDGDVAFGNNVASVFNACDLCWVTLSAGVVAANHV